MIIIIIIPWESQNEAVAPGSGGSRAYLFRTFIRRVLRRLEDVLYNNNSRVYRIYIYIFFLTDFLYPENQCV